MSVSPPDRLRALLAKPGFVVMPAVGRTERQAIRHSRLRDRIPVGLLRGRQPSWRTRSRPDLVRGDAGLVQQGTGSGIADPGASAAVEAAKDSGILVLARTDCRPTQGIDEAVARIEMYVKEGADILFLDSPADEVEIKRGIDAAAGRPSFVVLSPGAPRATPSQKQAAELGFKIGTYPTGML